jgi:hypothetical protein
MYKAHKKLLPLIAIGGTIALLTGCQTVVRENIIASIDTGLGATVAENKQTQLYELKAGYIHSQFFSVPTGKVVANETSDKTNCVVVVQEKDKRSNRADITPQVVSGIRASTSLADVILGMNISENFAVGDIAVNSDAATAMYISDAKSTNNAAAASQAVAAKNGVTYENSVGQSLNDPDRKKDIATLNDLIKKPLNTTAAYTADGKTFSGNQAADYANALAYDKGSTLKTIERIGGADLKDIIQKLITATK